ncbi:hypothetical protein JCM10908_000156 [Rhodotorula pacifica]|uniref:uncharacterized protein n=1 Tax=Rhodotorula pacifica TaxID=1495444 RepID=UPI00317FD88E
MAFFRRKAAAPPPAAPLVTQPTPAPTSRPAKLESKRKNRMSRVFRSSFSVGIAPVDTVVEPMVEQARPAPVVAHAEPARPERQTPAAASAAPTIPPVTAADDVHSTPAEEERLPPYRRSSRHSRIASLSSLRPLPPIPPTPVTGVGLGLLNAAVGSDLDESPSSESHSSTAPAVPRRTSLPAYVGPRPSQGGTSGANSIQDRRRASSALCGPRRVVLPAQRPSGVHVHVETLRHVDHGRRSSSATLPLRHGSSGAIGRERIAQLRAEWSSMSAASGESGSTKDTPQGDARLGVRSNSMYELQGPVTVPIHRRSSSASVASQTSRRASTASSLKPLKLETSASHPSLKQSLNKPIPPPPRPTRSSARYCLRPTRDFSTQTPANWEQVQEPISPTTGRPRNHTRGSSWGVPSLASCSPSPSKSAAPALPPVPAYASPAPSRFGLPSPSVYSVASFDTGRGWTRVSQGSRGTFSFGALDDLDQIEETGSPSAAAVATLVGAGAEGLAYDSPFVNYSMRLSPVAETVRTPLINSVATAVSPSHRGSPRAAPEAESAAADDASFKSFPPLQLVTSTDAAVSTAEAEIGSSTSERSPTSPAPSERSYDLESPPTSAASSVHSVSDNLDKHASLEKVGSADDTLAAPTIAVVLPVRTEAAADVATSEWIQAMARPAPTHGIPPIQLQARRFSEADKYIPHMPRQNAISAAERAAKGRSFFLVQALMGDVPTEGLVRDWARDADSDNDSDGVSLLGQPTSDESDEDEDA